MHVACITFVFTYLFASSAVSSFVVSIAYFSSGHEQHPNDVKDEICSMLQAWEKENSESQSAVELRT